MRKSAQRSTSFRCSHQETSSSQSLRNPFFARARAAKIDDMNHSRSDRRWVVITVCHHPGAITRLYRPGRIIWVVPLLYYYMAICVCCSCWYSEGCKLWMAVVMLALCFLRGRVPLLLFGRSCKIKQELGKTCGTSYRRKS